MEQEVLLEQKAMKKAIKKDANTVAVGLILYSLITVAVIVVDAICRTIFLLVKEERNPELGINIDAYMEGYMEEATSMIIGVILGVLFLIFLFGKKVSLKDIFVENRRMKLSHFWQIMCVFLGMQLVFMMVDGVLEAGLNLIGYSARESIEQATGGSNTLSMFLYAGFVGPFVEELIYRGFVLKTLQKHGKMVAIVVSAVLFGVMHANLPQGLYAFSVGIILGYVAVEYSIVWSIALHIINNCLMADLLGKVIAGFGEQTRNVIEYLVFICFFVLGAVFMWRNRSRIQDYARENGEPKKKYWYALTAVMMIVFIVAETALAILQLTPV